MKNTQKVTEKPKENNLLRNGSHIYLESELNYIVEGETAYCEHYQCGFKTEDFFEAEDHWFNVHYIW